MSAAFNPYSLHAIRIPLGMVTYQRLSWGAKCLYGRLALHRGKKEDGYCRPGLDTLASEMGSSIDTIDRWLKELIGEGFIQRSRRGRLAAECIFLEHPCLSNSAELRNQETPSIPQPCGVEKPANSADLPAQFRNSAVSIPQLCGLPNKEENVQENIHENVQSSSVSPEHEASDDEPALSENGKPNPEDREALVSVARDQLRCARAQGMGVPLEQVNAPDRQIVTKILAVFSDGADFEVWLEGTIQRGLARKAKDSRWGLYATDAQNHAEEIAQQRVADEKQRQDAEIAEKRRRTEEAERQRVLDTPVPLREALALINEFRKAQQAETNPGRLMYAPDDFRPPAPLRLRLERTGEPISASELMRLKREWKPCPECRDGGVLGNALDRDLRFCNCPAGIEAGYRDADYPEREIARIHADAKTLLVAAANDVLPSGFFGDAIAESRVSDDGETLEITQPETIYTIREDTLQQVLRRIGWKRAVRIERPALRERA